MLPHLATQDSVSMRICFPLHARMTRSNERWKYCGLWFFLRSNIVCGVRDQESCDLESCNSLKNVEQYERKGNKQTNKKPKLIKLKGESVITSLLPKGLSQQIGMDHYEFLQPFSLWFNTSLSFRSRHTRLNLFPSYCPCQKKFFKKSCMFLFHSYFLPCHPAVYKISLSHSAWGVFYSCVVKTARGFFFWAALFWRMGKPCSPVESQHGLVAPQWKRHIAGCELVTNCEALHIQAL